MFNLSSNLTSDDLWPHYVTLTSSTYEGSHSISINQVWFQSDFNFSKETQITNFSFWTFLQWPLTSVCDLDLINIWRFPFYIHKPSLVPIGLQLFKGDPNNEIFHFQLSSNLRWPLTSLCDLDLINIWRFPFCIHKPSLVPIGLQLFKGDPNNENQHVPPNLTSDDPWPWYVTFDLINIWRNPYCIFDPSLVVIGLPLFKGDPNNENLTKLEHTHIHTHIHTHRRNALSQNPHTGFQPGG